MSLTNRAKITTKGAQIQIEVEGNDTRVLIAAQDLAQDGDHVQPMFSENGVKVSTPSPKRAEEMKEQVAAKLRENDEVNHVHVR